MANKLVMRIEAKQAQLEEVGLLRQRFEYSDGVASSIDDDHMHSSNIIANFASNDYLGLSQSPELVKALHQGALKYGVGSGASPLVTGYQAPHVALEQKLCLLTGHQAGLLFCSGFSANQALISTLFDESDILLTDKLIHASVIDGVSATGAQLKRFVHNDVESATRLIERFKPQAVVTESVFSMDGDIAPLQSLGELAHENDAWFIVDDAHGFGIIGDNGLGASKLTPEIDVQLITFGKALGCQGAAILGSKTLIDYLVANARHYIYSTALSPASAHVALAAIALSERTPQLRQQLADNVHYFKTLCAQANLPLQASDTPIQPVVVGDSQLCLSIAAELKKKGVTVAAIRPPTVPKGSARLRVTLSAIHTQQQIQYLVSKLVERWPSRTELISSDA